MKKFRGLAATAALVVALSGSMLPAQGSAQTPTQVVPVDTSPFDSAQGEGVVRVTWTAPANATNLVGYSVAAVPNSGPTKAGSRAVCLSNACESTVLGLPAVEHNFTVTAIYADNSRFSASTEFTPVTVPASATNLSAVVASSTEIRLSWQGPENTGGLLVSEYLVRDSSNTLHATVTNPTALITGLTANTAYIFNVTAKNPNGESVALIQNAAITTNGNAPTQPSAPTVTPGTGQIAISWVAPSSVDAGLTGYKVYIFDSAGALVGGVRTPSPATATSLEVTGLANATYRVSVVATNRWGDSASSSQTVTTVGVVTQGSAGSGGAAPAAAAPATTSSTVSPGATQSSQSKVATDSNQATPAETADLRRVSDFFTGGAVTRESKAVAINRSWRLVRASVGEVLHATIRDLAPARARVSTWTRTPDGKTHRLSNRMTSSTGLLTSPSYKFKEPGNYLISWVYKGVKRSLVVFVSE